MTVIKAHASIPSKQTNMRAYSELSVCAVALICAYRALSRCEAARPLFFVKSISPMDRFYMCTSVCLASALRLCRLCIVPFIVKRPCD